MRELEIEREETERRAADLERKRQKCSLFAVWGKKAPTVALAPTTTANAPAEEASAPSDPKPTALVACPTSPDAELPAGTIFLRGGRRVRMYEPPDEFTRVAPPLAYHSRRDAAQIDQLLSRGAAEAQLELHGRRRRAQAARKRKRADRNVSLQPWQLARYKFLKPDCDSVRPPYWGTWTKHSEAVRARRPLGRDARLDYEVESEDDWEDEGEGEDLGSDDEADEAEPERPRDTDGAADEDGDGFVVADGYLSEDEQGHAEGGDGGPLRSASAQQARRAVRLVPHLVINLWPAAGAHAPPALAEYAVKLAASTPIQLEPAEPPPESVAKPRATKSSLTAPETLALAEMVHGSADGIHPLAERFRAAHDGHSRVFVEACIREMAARTKRVTAAGDPYDAIAIWIVRAELSEGLGLDEPPPSRSRAGGNRAKCAIAKAVAGTPWLDQLLKKQAPPPPTAAEPAHSPGLKMQSQGGPAAGGTPVRPYVQPHPSPPGAMPADADANAAGVDPVLGQAGVTADQGGAGAAKSHVGSLNGLFLNRGAAKPSPETGSGGSKTESRTVPAADGMPLPVPQQPATTAACRPTIGLAATDPYIAELMATGRPKPKAAQAAAPAPPQKVAHEASSPNDQGAAGLPPQVSLRAFAAVAKPAFAPPVAPVFPPPSPQDAVATPSPPAAPAPAAAPEHEPDSKRKRGRQVTALPPGWAAVEHTSKAGKTYTRYAGPKRAKAVSKAEAWRLHQRTAEVAAAAALAASAVASTDAARTVRDKVARADASEVVHEDAGPPAVASAAAEAPLPDAPVLDNMEVEPPAVCASAPEAVPPLEAAVEMPAALGMRAAYSWAALEAKLRGDAGDAPNNALLEAWTDPGLAAIPSEGVLGALVSSLGLDAVSAARRDVSLRCLGDSLIEWQKLNAATAEADRNEPTAVALATYLLSLPDLAPNLLSCVGDPDLQLRKNAWRCANLLLTQRCAVRGPARKRLCRKSPARNPRSR
jgi:hypothetical protein